MSLWYIFTWQSEWMKRICKKSRVLFAWLKDFPNFALSEWSGANTECAITRSSIENLTVFQRIRDSRTALFSCVSILPALARLLACCPQATGAMHRCGVPFVLLIQVLSEPSIERTWNSTLSFCLLVNGNKSLVVMLQGKKRISKHRWFNTVFDKLNIK